MNIRHPLAALLGVAGLVVGAVAAMGGSATAAPGDLTTTVSFKCTTKVGASVNNFDWDAQITLAAVRPAASTTVTVTAAVSDMPGIAPVKMNGFPGTDKLVLDLAGASTTLNGSGNITNSGANQPVPMPALQGTLTSSAATLAVTATSIQLVVSGISTDCTPSAGASMGALTVVEGTPPTQTPTPTTTTSATATPKASASASPTAGSAKGTPAPGEVDFACVLNPLNSKFDYPATISVSGSREKAGDDVALSAKMSDLPGISPVPIDGQMDVTLDLTVGGTKTTLKGGTHATADPKAKVPVPILSGSVAADEDELDVKVSGFTFNFAALSIDAVCTASSVALSKMTVGSEPVDTGDTPSASSSTTTGGTTLPQTGGGDSMPVVALWALALTLLGVAGLLCVPRARRQH
jgi:hypothetical protein